MTTTILSCDNCKREGVPIKSDIGIYLYRNWSKGDRFNPSKIQHYNSRCRYCQNEKYQSRRNDQDDEYSDESEDESESESVEDESNDEQEVNLILDDRMEGHHRYFLVEWSDFSRTWEDEENLTNCEEILNNYLNYKNSIRKRKSSSIDEETSHPFKMRHIIERS